MANYNLRGIPEDVDDLVKRNVGSPIGHASPRLSWLQSLVCIGALGDPDVNIHAYALWQRALQNAKRRGEDDIRSYEKIIAKLDEEQEEYRQAYTNFDTMHSALVYRLCNVLYYAVQRYAHDNHLASFERIYRDACTLANIPPAVAFACANAKISDRVSRDQKDIPSEYAEIDHILSKWKKSLKSS